MTKQEWFATICLIIVVSLFLTIIIVSRIIPETPCVNLGKLVKMDVKKGFNSSDITIVETDKGYYTLVGAGYSFEKGSEVVVKKGCVRGLKDTETTKY